MNIKLPLVFILLLPVLSFSQNITELGLKKQHIEEKIANLEDSLDLIEGKIEVLEEQGTPRKDLIEVIPEIQEWVISKDAVLLATPSAIGQVLSKLKKGTAVQKVDQLGEYYLVCITGSCGYVHQDFLQKNIAENKMNKKRTKDGEKDKGFMG